MKNSNIINALLIALGTLVFSGPASAASLLEIYQQALQSDPQIHEAEARRLAALEAKPQARGVLLPQINATGDWAENDVSGANFSFINNDTTTFDQSSTNTNWNVSLRQSLFRWDQIVNLKRADKTVTRAEAVREAAQQDLIVRVAQRYFDVLAAEDRLTSINANGEAIARQLEQAKQRFEVGLIAITDVQESQAAYDQSVANEIGAKRTLATARELMREITGEYESEFDAPADDFPLINPENNEASWVELSLAQNLNLVASRLDEQLARDEIAFRKNGHYPTLDLVVSTGENTSEGDVFSSSSAGSATNFFDDSTTRDQVSLQFTVPLFAGGGTSSRVREAVYLHRASREQLQRVTRETERQARDAYLGVLSEISRVKALEQAVASSRTALQATQAGYEVGTRTIVEVLNSQFSLYVAITNFYQSRYDYIMNAIRLKQAAGTLQIQDLEKIDRWLKDRPSPEEAAATRQQQGS
ncbi:MAG: TolC family outer membrane protein [Gammaproteobacteria bacterium]|nr:TolC family outer membrane protein [Gammaproteobacteria bacterium]MDH5241353.1 TolC family outer membrane protein [Gammaproteobacteria bacterium]MDH5261525.1 TolC family outer membrane protein [Gammaproteobacteria bacterium]MDH5583297.1 TolC family outer membrane protein [Gammaproteobacteria bacterium]